MALAQGIELDAAVLSSRHLHDAHRVLVEDERIWVVVYHHDVVLLGECHQLFVGFALCHTACRHVRIVGPHQFYVAQVHLFQSVEIGLPSVILSQIVVGNLGTQNLVDGGVGRVSRVRDKHLIARVAEGERYVQNAFLATYEGLDFCNPVEVYIIPALIETSHCFAQLWYAHRRLISVCVWIVGYLAELINGLLRRRHVWTSDGQTDDVLALGIKFSHFLQFAAEVVFLYFRYSIGWLYHNSYF